MKKDTQIEMFEGVSHIERVPVIVRRRWNYKTAIAAWMRWLVHGEDFNKMNEAINWMFNEFLSLRASNIYLRRKIKKLEKCINEKRR